MKTIEEVFTFNLRRLRGSRTQAEIAELAGIPLRSYQRAEYGDIPQGPNRQAISRALGASSETELFMDPDFAGTVTPKRALEVLAAALEMSEAIGSNTPLESIPAPILATLSRIRNWDILANAIDLLPADAFREIDDPPSAGLKPNIRIKDRSGSRS